MSALAAKLKLLAKDTVIYGVGSVLVRSVSFFLIPIYTRVFTVADYGIIEMISVISMFLSVIMMIGMDSTQTYFFFQQKEHGIEAQSRIVSSVLQIRIVAGIVCIAMAMILSPLLNSLFFGGGLSWEYFAVAFSAAWFVQTTNQSSQVFRLLYKPFHYLGITLIQAVGTAIIALILILVFDQGIFGVYLGSLCASVFATAFGWILVRKHLRLTGWNRGWYRRLMKFGAPLIASGFAMFVLSTSDRWFITTFRDADELGLYAVGAKFGVLIALAVETFRTAWGPVSIDAMYSAEGKEMYRIVGRSYVGLGIIGVVILTTLSPLLVSIIAPEEYFESYRIVGVIAWFSVFYGFCLFGCRGIWKAEKNYWWTISLFIASSLNILLDSLWVPEYGIMGAAIATSISFLVLNVILLIISEFYWRVGYPYFVFLLQIAIGAGATYLILSLYRDEITYLKPSLVCVLTILAIAAMSVPPDFAYRLLRRIIRKQTGDGDV
ncbi:MAG: oligosaccharide flippase family protein [Planctomycetes bacterium]|nr:oligosaccharide flippase family protein [Planctomycetota bacterium]